jgi:hypothetical protein
MAQLCGCSEEAGRVALSACASGQLPVYKDYLVPTYGSDGSRNKITSADLDDDGKLTEAAILTRINATDIRDRWMPFPVNYENANPDRTDAIIDTTERGTQFFIQEGVITMDAQLKNIPHAWHSEVTNLRSCYELSVFHIDKDGKPLGEINDAGTELFPRQLENNNIQARPFYSKDTETAYTQITYQLSRLANEARFVGLAGSEVDLLKVEGLIPLFLKQGTGTTNTIINIDAIVRKYGDVENQGQTGFDDANFSVVNATTGLALTISTVDDNGGGNYDITLSAPAATTPVEIIYVEDRTSTTVKGFGSNTLSFTLPA